MTTTPSDRAVVKDELPRIPIFHDGTAVYHIFDNKSGLVLCSHKLRQVSGPHARAYYEAERKVAVRIAEVLNATGDEGIERVIDAIIDTREQFTVEHAKEAAR